MDINSFSYCLKDLISQNDKVAVPGLGLFFAAMMPAKFSDNRAVINPPYRQVFFTESDTFQDGDNAFITKVSQYMRCSFEQANTELQWCLDRLKTELQQNKTCSIPGLGVMKADSKNEYYFITDEGVDIYLDGIGFEPVFIKAPQKKKKRNNKVRWWAVLLLVVTFLILGTVVFAYMFKDRYDIASTLYGHIDHVLNTLLYTKEELELLGL